MARVKAGTWFNLVAGLAVGTTAQPLLVEAQEVAPGGGLIPPAIGTAPEAPAPAPVRPSKMAITLDLAQAAQSRGDFDTAAGLIKQIEGHVGELSPEQQTHYTRLRETVGVASEARKAGAEQLRLAEKAMKENRPNQVTDLLRRVSANEAYLSPEDKARLAQLKMSAPAATQSVLKGDRPSDNGMPLAGSALATSQARSRLQMARKELAQFNFERTEQLVHDAELLQPKLAAGEDSPKKIRDDLAKLRSDPKALLNAGRVALGRGDYDRAEQFGKLSDKASSTFTWGFWGDNPSKLLADVHQLRGAVAKRTPTTPKPGMKSDIVTASAKETVPAPASVPPAPASADTNAQAQQLLKDARAALAAGDVAKAKKCNEQARQLKPNFRYGDDNPEKVASEIAKVEMKGKATSPAMVATSTDKIAPPRTKADAVALLNLGRTQLAENKLDEATQTALKVNAAKSISWGLFDDSPDKLRQDIDKARVKRNREESVKVLADARRLYEEGKYDEASRTAFQAQTLHGAYNIWDLGDRPERVLADIQTAKIKLAKGQPVETVKHTPNSKSDSAVAKGANDRENRAREMLAEARVAAQAGDTTHATELAQRVKNMKVALNQPGDDSADAVLKDIRVQASTSKPATAVASKPAATPKARAMQLVAEGHALQKSGKMVEARDKMMEAQRLGGSFGPNEESPAQALQALAAEVRWQVKWYMEESDRLTATSAPDMAQRGQKAEQHLLQAKSLCLAFGLDAQPVAVKMDTMHARLGAPATMPAAVQATAVATGAKNQGQEMLEKARLEIQRGETTTARKLAEDALQGPFGVQDDAMAVLRSIDAEEFNQRRLQANRTFDAAMAAFNRRDYVQASNILASIDANNLEGSRKAKLREVSLLPEMQPAGKSAIVQVKATEGPGLPGLPVPGVPAMPPADTMAPGKASVSDGTPGDALLKTTEALRQVKFQQLRQQGLDIQRDASEKFRTGQTDSAIDSLQDYLASLAEVQLEPNQINMLKRPVEARLQQFKLLKAQRDFLTQDAAAGRRFTDKKNKDQLVTENKEKQIANLMKQYNTFVKEGKYTEAERLAIQAHELDPDNVTAATAVSFAKMHARIAAYKKINNDKDEFALNALNGTDQFGPPGAVNNDIVFDKDRTELSRGRDKKWGTGIFSGRKTEKEREIEQKLTTPVTLNFTNTPLRKVIDDLRAWQEINIHVDEHAAADQGISLDQVITIKLENLAMKSCLNLLLKGTHLTYIISDDVLQITTESQAKGKLQMKSMSVADLINPIPDFGAFKEPSAVPTLLSSVVASPTAAPTPTTPVTGPLTLTQGTSTGTPSTSPFGSERPQAVATQNQKTKTTTEESLMELIKNSVAPNSWADKGGPGTIEYFPLTQALVINQTQDIQEQVADLLAALRRLQDQEVAVEVRFISLGDQFFERIGVDFNVNILTGNSKFQPQLTTGIFQNGGQINQFTPSNFLSGLTPAGTLTSDLNIPITTNTYAQTFPNFGGYQNIPGFGGLTLGLAFLSDIQVFLFLEAVQGDTRNNVMQAPKLTLFNGQTATLQVNDFQYFVTSVQVVPQLGQLTYNPLTTQFPLGVQLTIQAVISADRRFVRMSLAPNLTNLATQQVNLFPVVVPIFPQFDNTGTGQPVVFTQYIQQPIINQVSVQTTVAVPDGGTVLMGGLKLLQEERKEYGPPILSKIPYLNRLFKNTSYGRDAQSLLIMVTPRIIIQEEEEERQTGVTRPPSGAF